MLGRLRRLMILKRGRNVMDNLNTHSIASLYQAFPAEKAYALAGLCA